MVAVNTSKYILVLCV